MRFLFGRFEILIDDDPTYSLGSAGNVRHYELSYRLDDESFKVTSRHSVRVEFPDDETISKSCILTATGGASGIHEHSALVNGNNLIIAVGPFVAALELPTLELMWKTQSDSATCFGVYHCSAERCYISHGELEIVRLAYDGTVQWSNGGADIFTNGFAVKGHLVEAIDWNGDRYVWDIRTGNVSSE